MGVSQFNYIISWIVYFITNGLIVSIVMMLIVRFFIISDETKFAQGYGFWNIAVLYFSYSLANIGFMLVLCTFFSKAKTGSQGVTFILLIINFLYFLRLSGSLTQSQPFTIFVSIFPQLCFNIAISNIAFLQNPYSISTNFPIGFEQGTLTLLISAVVYLLLALYLDEIMPNQLGSNKHPLFFLGVGYKAPQEALK